MNLRIDNRGLLGALLLFFVLALVGCTGLTAQSAGSEEVVQHMLGKPSIFVSICAGDLDRVSERGEVETWKYRRSGCHMTVTIRDGYVMAAKFENFNESSCYRQYPRCFAGQ
jgi:hypothetical protein